MSERVILLGLDFGSTTSSALIASAKVARSAATGHVQLDDVQVIYKSEPVFTPFFNQNIDTEKVAKLIANWFDESGISTKDVFSGGSMITGLAAQADNAAVLSKLIIKMVGESVIATADDPCLESWLAFKGSCGALSRYHADAPILNFDIGGGTTNVALGVDGDVQNTGCYFIGARHFQFVAGSYQLSAISPYGAALLDDLSIHKKIGESLNENECEEIILFNIKALESIVTNDVDFLIAPIAQKHTQVAINFNTKAQPKITFSGGVGELLYKISADETMPTTTFYGDFGIDLAQAISRSALLSADLKTCVPEHKGRATVVGLTLHSTEISGSTIYLPNSNCLPLRDLPIIAKLAADAPTNQWQNAFALAAKRQAGSQTYAACIQITACSNSLEQVRALATQIKHALQANIHVPSQPLVILVERNIGKALGNYISNWGQLDYNLIVIDEVNLRDAHFVHIGRVQQGMIPVSFYGLS
jgi:ethanolamine utilization protein EutA